MALLKPGWETPYHVLRAVEPVACMGIKVDQVKLPGGRFNLLLTGMARATILMKISRVLTAGRCCG